MDSNIKLLLLSITVLMLLVYIALTRYNVDGVDNKTIESFVLSPTQEIIEALRQKYKKYETIEIPISTTDYGRICMDWRETNNPDYSKFTGNKCATL
jgi:hypothetical protein